MQSCPESLNMPHSMSSRWIRYFLVFVLAVFSVYFLYLVREILLTFLLGALIAYVSYRPVCFLESKGIKRCLAIFAFYFIFIGFFILVLVYLFPVMVQEVSELGKMLPQYSRQAQSMADSLQGSALPDRMTGIIMDNLTRIENYVYESFKNFLSTLHIFLGRVLAILFSPILAFYIINDWEKISHGLLDILSPGGRREAEILFHAIDRVLLEFIKGNLIVAVVVGFMVGITAALLGVRLPVLIGMGAGIAELIPFFGAFLGAIPALIVAFSGSLKLGLYMTVAIIIIQQLEGNILTPRIIGSLLGMHPLLMVFALLAGGELYGIWGMLAAVPLVAVGREVIKWLFPKVVAVKTESRPNGRIY